MCVHTRMEACVRVCMHVWRRVCVCMYIQRHMYVCACLYGGMCTCLCMSIGRQLYVCACMYEDTYLFVYMRGAQRTISGAVPSEASNGFFMIVSH